MSLKRLAAGLGTAVAGYVLANYYDYPPAQLTVVLLCLLVAAAWVLHRLVGRLFIYKFQMVALDTTSL